MKILRLVSLLGIVLMISGCGLIARLIPPIEVTDPLALDGKRFDAEMTTPANLSASLGALAQGEASLAFTFEGDPDINLRGFNVGELLSEITSDAQMTLTRPTGGFPDDFVVTAMSLNVTVTQEDGAREVSLASEFSGNVPFAIDAACDTDTATSCSYTFSGDETDIASVLLFVLEATGQDARELVNIVRTAGSHTVNVTLGITTESNPDLENSTLTVTLRHVESSIKLR